MNLDVASDLEHSLHATHVIPCIKSAVAAVNVWAPQGTPVWQALCNSSFAAFTFPA